MALMSRASPGTRNSTMTRGDHYYWLVIKAVIAGHYTFSKMMFEHDKIKPVIWC